MSGCRRFGGDRGAFTVELAAGLPALMVLLFFGLTAVSAVVTKAQCLDAAREAALAEARGGPGSPVAARMAPAGAEIRLGGDRESVTATVSVRVRLFGTHVPGITVTASAVAAREPAAGPVG
ncbi:TadE family type IV pilus minor pilin [Actinoplanes oblitus]|uniref:TadE family type IV pilus minor pilin n=1 Tax=Actinoplanes oblitus TaxID=3040509 RepID=A0ABY8WM17_9ACTN|nr:TadE family type IV pilus minor pilin [Actinoplanes oblitus]WIM96810.1 TadE family type IV pilus minor pilin [Actinoplanes oblitus]